MKRCKWCNLNNPKYVKYHDTEWGVFNNDEKYLYEMFILETFQAGLSWECILNKKENFEKAYDNFDIDKIIKYDEGKINSLFKDDGIIKNKKKIIASINNSKIYKNIVLENGSFYNYLCKFTKEKIYYENDLVTSPLSDEISANLKSLGMTFVGSITIYSYLQAVGIINSHEIDCAYRDVNFDYLLNDITMFKKILNDYLKAHLNVEIKLTINNEDYLIITLENKLSFQKIKNGKEIYFPSVKELFETNLINGKSLNNEFKNIQKIEEI